MTEPPATAFCAAFGAAGLLLVAVLSGCVRNIDGVAARAGNPGVSQLRQPKTSHGKPAPGIETTLPEHIAPNSFVCFPEPAADGIGAVAQVPDPVAPRITVTVPGGWTSEPGQKDLALSLGGPDGMTGTVTVTATKLDPGRAFSDYAATLAHSKSDFQVETVGAKFCGFSSQKLVGTFAEPSGRVEFADRLTHIWTNTADYLVAIHVEGPEDTPGFGAAKTTLTQDFAVVIP